MSQTPKTTIFFFQKLKHKQLKFQNLTICQPKLEYISNIIQNYQQQKRDINNIRVGYTSAYPQSEKTEKTPT